MKYSKSIIWLYWICAIKFINTCLFFVMPNDLYFLSIVTIPVCLASAYHSELAVLCLVILATSIILWVCGIMLALMGIKFYNARRNSIVMFTVVTILDFITSFISDSLSLTISCSATSAIILIICVICLNTLKKKQSKKGDKENKSITKTSID